MVGGLSSKDKAYRIAFERYLRTGEALDLGEMVNSTEHKFNPYHDAIGRFSSPPGVSVSYGSLRPSGNATRRNLLRPHSVRQTAENRDGAAVSAHNRAPLRSDESLQGVIRRRTWESSPPIISRLKVIDRPYDEIVFHHTSTRRTAQSVYDLHVGERKWGDVGYHFMISADGRVFEGRSLKYEGAHVSGKNPGKIGIAFLGDYTLMPNTAKQISSARHLIDQLRARYPTIKRLSDHGMYDSSRVGEGVMSANYYLQRMAIERRMAWGPELK